VNMEDVTAAIAQRLLYLPLIVAADPGVPGTITPPHAYCGEIDIDYHVTFGGAEEVEVKVRVLVGHSAGQEEQALLKQFMRKRGSNSIIKALEDEPTLGGLVDDLVVPRMQGHRMYRVGESLYYGAEWPVRLIGDLDTDEEDDD
jgi:hypothetical protein